MSGYRFKMCLQCLVEKKETHILNSESSSINDIALWLNFFIFKMITIIQYSLRLYKSRLLY